jgi:putative DNA primase/helicase
VLEPKPFKNCLSDAIVLAVMTALETISNIILKNELYILPLYSIREGGVCSCGKEDCSSPGKHPLFRYNWKIIASNKPEKVMDWFESYKKMNFGLATGRLSKVTNKYLVVIDVDATDHPFLKTLPDTFSYRTGSGGYHFWFWSKYPVKNSVSLLADKVDVRGTDGYVVIPPSKHKKGNYNTINNVDIADLPQRILTLLLAKPKVVVSCASPNTKTKQPALKNNLWTTQSVPEIRIMMQSQLVPEGVRNVVMHRLLSSDRAKGCLKRDLQTNARVYLKTFEHPQTFKTELPAIINSVLTYPAYNNNHEKINEQYVAWLKNNRNIKLTPKEANALVALDNTFFALLQPTDIKQHRVTLEQVLNARMSWLKSQGQKYISNYKTQLLAKKLTSLGFKRTRTAKGNWWNVYLPEQASHQELKVSVPLFLAVKQA